jgi:A/G-specific adenine glycosylase
VLKFCVAGQRGDPENFPNLAAKKMEQVSVTRVWIERQGSLLLHLSADSARRFANMHELPTAAQAGLTDAQAAAGKLLAKKRRGITRYQITESIHTAPAPRGKLPTGLVWVPLTDLDSITLSGPHRRWVKEILANRP